MVKAMGKWKKSTLRPSFDREEHVKTFWSAQTSPLHRHDTPEWYRLYAEEVNLLLAAIGYTEGRVLEFGCGNGALFPYLNVDEAEYHGIDLSESLLSQFRQAYPTLRLDCVDIADFVTTHKFSLILSNQVLQCIGPKTLDRIIARAGEILLNGGSFLACNIPMRSARHLYMLGELSARPEVDFTRYVKSNIRHLIYGDSMGHWYSPREFFKWTKAGFNVQVYGSLFHPYRFSIALIKER